MAHARLKKSQRGYIGEVQGASPPGRGQGRDPETAEDDGWSVVRYLVLTMENPRLIALPRRMGKARCKSPLRQAMERPKARTAVGVRPAS